MSVWGQELGNGSQTFSGVPRLARHGVGCIWLGVVSFSEVGLQGRGHALHQGMCSVRGAVAQEVSMGANGATDVSTEFSTEFRTDFDTDFDVLLHGFCAGHAPPLGAPAPPAKSFGPPFWSWFWGSGRGVVTTISQFPGVCIDIVIHRPLPASVHIRRHRHPSSIALLAQGHLAVFCHSGLAAWASSMAKGPQKKSSAATASPAKSPAGATSPAKGKTPEQLAAQKIYDNMKSSSQFQKEIMVEPKSKLTMVQYVARDIRAEMNGERKIVWGKRYYRDLRNLFSVQSKDHAGAAGAKQPEPAAAVGAIATPAAASTAQPEETVCARLLSAMIAVKRGERNARDKMMMYIAQPEPPPNGAEICGVLRWGMGLKLNCRKVQLPMAKKILAWLVRTVVETM